MQDGTTDEERRILVEAHFGRRCYWHSCHKRYSAKYSLPLCDEHIDMISTRVATINGGPELIPCDHDKTIGLLKDELARTRAKVADLRAGLLPAAEPAERAKPKRDGTVYYVKVGANIKIGWTADLAKRMRQYPPDSSLLATEPGTRSDEQKRHKMFAAHRTHGREWYAAIPSLLHHIETVKAKHGEPASVAFGAQPVTIPQRREPQYIGGNRIGNPAPRTVRG